LNPVLESHINCSGSWLSQNRFWYCRGGLVVMGGKSRIPTRENLPFRESAQELEAPGMNAAKKKAERNVLESEFCHSVSCAWLWERCCFCGCDSSHGRPGERFGDSGRRMRLWISKLCMAENLRRLPRCGRAAGRERLFGSCKPRIPAAILRTKAADWLRVTVEGCAWHFHARRFGAERPAAC